MSLRIALVGGEVPTVPAGFERLASLGPATLIGVPGTFHAAAGNAALVGWTFRSDNHAPVTSLTDAQIRDIAASQGRWALHHLWGNYLLFWIDGQGDVWLLRSPITGPAFFQYSGGGTLCAFTDLALARALGCRLDRLEPEAVDAAIRYPLMRAPATGIADVREIIPGEISRFGKNGPEGASWSPWDHALCPPCRIEADELRSQVHRVVTAWSGRFERIQLELSGGIDSSIVAACLADRVGPWRALTMVTAEPDGDERVYARAMADRVRVELEELLLAREPADPLAMHGPLRARPGGFGLLAANDAAQLAAARDYRADALFSGTGGDGTFGYQASIAPALDAFRFAGLRSALGAAGDQASITGDNLWNAIFHGIKGWFRDLRIWPVDDSFLSSRFAAPRPSHPWLNGAGRVAPGQRRYGLGPLLIQPFLDGYDRALALPKIAPLLSQPLIEFGLGVASWQWGEGGINRALAREAFRRDLPDIILARRSKGRILSLFLPAFEANRARLRPYLLGGWLASSGILDGDAVDAILDGRSKPDALAMIRILHLTDIERWARSIVGE